MDVQLKRGLLEVCVLAVLEREAEALGIDNQRILTDRELLAETEKRKA